MDEPSEGGKTDMLCSGVSVCRSNRIVYEGFGQRVLALFLFSRGADFHQV